MPEAVKISELPVMSTVQAGDILPVVDAQLTQTGRATAAQVAAIGGGPPGDNTVSTAKMQDGAVTAAKTSFSATDKLLGRATAGAGVGEEIPCTSWARGLLAMANGANAANYIGTASTLNNATLNSPTLNNATINTAAINGATLASPVFTGSATATVGNGTTAYPAFFVRAWAFFDGSISTPTIFASGNVTSVARTIGTPISISGASPPGVTTGYTYVLYTVNFTAPMPDANYAFAGVGSNQLNAELPSLQSGTSNLTTSHTFGVGVVTSLSPMIVAVPMPRLTAIYVR